MLAGTTTGLSKARPSKPAKSRASHHYHGPQTTPDPGLRLAFLFSLEAKARSPAMLFRLGPLFHRASPDQFCGSARYLWGRWESRQGQRGLSRRRNPLLLSVLPRSLQDATLAPHLGECPKPSVLEGLAAKFLLPPMACRVSQQEHLLPFYSSGPFSLLPPLKISSIHHSLCPGSRYLAAFRHPKRGSAIPALCPPSPSCTSAQAARTQGFFVPWVWNLLCCTTNWAISSSPLNQMKDSSGSSTIAFF